LRLRNRIGSDLRIFGDQREAILGFVRDVASNLGLLVLGQSIDLRGGVVVVGERGKLLRLTDIAKIIGVSTRRADQLRHRPDFPLPGYPPGAGNRWAASEIRRWAKQYDGGGRKMRPTCSRS